MKHETQISNQLRAVRTRLGISQQELAVAAGVARQTISGMEAGLYAPSAAVALKLARALGCRVEELFWLNDDLPIVEATPALASSGAKPATPRGAERVVVAQIQGRWVAHALTGEQAFAQGMIPADGVGTWAKHKKTVAVQLMDDPEALQNTVVIAGCAPALSLWARSAERWHPGLRIHWVHANSTVALQSLARREVHIAGVHLSDPQTGEDNLPYVRQVLQDQPVTLVNFGVWEEGLLTARNNPGQLTAAPDLARPEVSIVNREVGAGARMLLDSYLQESGVPAATVRGYDRITLSHQGVARAVAAGDADAGVSSAAVAAAYGLSFVPLRRVRYDLAILNEYLTQEPVRQLLSSLDHRWVRSQLHVLGGYDTAKTGAIMASTGV